MDRARDLASELANRYRPRDPALTRPGFSRGIDYYKFDALVQVLAVVLAVYRNTAGRYPDLLNPKLYSEKVSALKFLAPLKVPESGNKLLTASFLTPEARSTIRIPEVVWHSAEPILPMNGAMEDGDYYLKTNHGSGRCRRICSRPHWMRFVACLHRPLSLFLLLASPCRGTARLGTGSR